MTTVCRSRPVRLLMAVLLAVPVLVLAQSALAPGVAQARCAAVGTPLLSTLEQGGVLWVSEAPISGTCNNNGWYEATFRSHIDGWRASIWIQNNGEWQGWYGGYNTNQRSYYYADHNTTSLMHFCLDNGVTWWCGWGGTAEPTFTHAHRGYSSGF